MPRTRTPSVLAAVLALALTSPACIKREPNPNNAGTPAAGAAPGTSKFAAATSVDILGPAGTAAFQVQGDAKKVVVTEVPVEGQPFPKALRVKVVEAGGSEWSVQIVAKTTAPVAKGDAILATFYLRAIEPTEGSVAAETSFLFEHAGEPYTKSITYPVKFGVGEWRKVQVRFLSEESYAPGGANLIFRLGYEPETFEVGGVAALNYGTQVSQWDLPSTEQADHRADVALAQAAPPAPKLQLVDGGPLAFEIAPDKVVGPISPYVYGINSQSPDKLNTTVRRMGGNRQTVYNWELNASSAGSDWNHVNDNWPCTNLGFGNCNEPGAQFTDFVEQNKKLGIESLVTIPLIDYVSADTKGPVSEKEAAPSPRFLRSHPRKPGPLAATPDLSDGDVYQDEFVAHMVKKLGRADAGGARFYSLDNEPALWPSTHPRVHPQRVTYGEIVSRSEATAAAITELDPSATVLGAVAFGWSEFMSLTSAPDAKEKTDAANLGQTGGTPQGGANYLEYFLSQMKSLEKKHKRRLVHVLDVHWYPEPKGTKRITDDKDASPKTITARLEAPRSLWDPDYREKSWITDQWGKPIRLIPWLRDLVAKHYPGTKLSMTEYNYGAGNHVSGGLAQADALGIFGREGLFMANYWGNGAGVGEMPDYVGAAFKLFRNYDGKGGAFGDTSVGASIADLTKGSVYAATDSKHPGVLTIVAINKSQQADFKATFNIAGKTKYKSGEAYRFGSDASAIKALGKVDVKDNKVAFALPRLSATIFVVRK